MSTDGGTKSASAAPETAEVPSSTSVAAFVLPSPSAAATSSVAKAPEKTTAHDKICRFAITNLQGNKRGHAQSDYTVDLLLSKHSLYDIADCLFNIIARKHENVTDDAIYSHLWGMTFNKKRYSNGWRHRTFPDSNEWERPANKTDIDEGEPRLLSGLEPPLATGQKGSFSGESASFDFAVESIKDCPEKSEANQTKYPCVSKVTVKLSAEVKDDWLTTAEKSECQSLATSWKNFYTGENGWKRNRRDGGWERSKPNSPVWNTTELEIMGLLMKADCKFKKSWTNILQYAFVNRTESACSMRWYQLKKEGYRLEHIGKRLSNSQRVVLAKRLSKTSMKKLLDFGKPVSEPRPRSRELEDDDDDEFY